ncbi:aldo/keto reductase [Desulfococcus multivorans]|uniref:NADP-dependent oxidoreductase domain containing protein n=1 Tax=Desulfococcus multivorans DSM 2059 TaxID=1121405 RepID=S7U7A8_DESML|nr:aldo/keto reductase [Desulfococcus multivorans]AOY57250.1 aldo/keto reductase [Desulfococcus multivorans]AQV02835.2 hypothetical protein B2D07_02220 [Desulfococcus multivorans]EPR45035.1 NADP-dependent oxidoreductase domain containing protein [Desulfococcus multivorans DSM 2059]SKA27094.1 Predicted oxidoreductase [Desulfococcus multivorans DSM 2059]
MIKRPGHDQSSPIATPAPVSDTPGHRVLGRTGVRVSEIGFGSWAVGGGHRGLGYGPTDDRNSLRAIREACEAGCNFFDTADSYGFGHSEELLGQALHRHRHEVIIATKVGYDFYRSPPLQNFHPAYIRFALHQSLQRLRTEYVDLYQLHNPPPEILFRSDVIEALDALRQQGKIRCLGVSVNLVQDAVEALAAAWPEVVQVPYNLLAPEAETMIFSEATRKQIGIIAREPLANGFLSGKYHRDSHFPPSDIRSLWGTERIAGTAHIVEQLKPYCRQNETLAQLAIRFVLEAPAVSTVIPGCKTADQVKENFAMLRARRSV